MVTLVKSEGGQVQLAPVEDYQHSPMQPYKARADRVETDVQPGVPVVVPWWEGGQVVGWARAQIMAVHGLRGGEERYVHVEHEDGSQRGHYDYSLARV